MKQVVPQDTPLRVVVILGAEAALGNGPLRLIDHLQNDPRFELAGLFSAPVPPPVVSPVLRLQQKLETALLPAPRPFQPRLPCPPVTPLTTCPPCDVVIDFSHAPAVDALAEHTRHGLWRLSVFGPLDAAHPAMAGLPASPVFLVRVGDAQVLAQAVYDTKFLAGRNTEYVREKSVQLIERELARLCRDGGLTGHGAATELSTAGAMQMFGYAGRAALDVGGRIRRKIATRAGRAPRRFELRTGRGGVLDFDPATAQAIAMPPNRLWADPFLITEQGRTYCFFEDFDYATGLGHIGVGVLTDQGMDYIGPAHVAPHHLSYPFVFRQGDAIYMMPETHQAGRLEIWKATDFPTGWTLHATAFEGVGLADTSLLFWQDDWWIFTNICRDGFGDFCGELHLFRTEGPELNWIEPHPLNPVVIGADTARGGGRVHVVNGALYRASQDNSGGVYGYGLNIMQVDALTPQEYREHRLRHITPDFAPGLIGCHHMDTSDGWFVIDVRHP